jgi:hypothetical protein
METVTYEGFRSQKKTACGLMSTLLYPHAAASFSQYPLARYQQRAEAVPEASAHANSGSDRDESG